VTLERLQSAILPRDPTRDPTRDPIRDPIDDESFVLFVAQCQLRLRQALVARYGLALGQEATAAAFAWAWENWEAASQLTNPVGYLFRVGQSSTRSNRRWAKRTTSIFPKELAETNHTLEVDLGEVLERLSRTQRTCVLLVHGHNWSYQEVASLLEINVSAVRNHVHRGMKRLRKVVGI
jgi:RNA polymerase sigma factor (sigma-70 family)